MKLDDFNPVLFWDTDMRTLSVEDHAGFIISRVCMLGGWKDWQILKEMYGIPRMKHELLHARYLDKKTLNYFSLVLEEPKENFRCYTLAQWNPGHWDY
ncbi:MAG TPA: hypothetical protein PLI08_06670 [Bacteroidia bacterium]|nr:hypothetical protein [Bacteroidia bacterium]